jgi:hypothetical protein
MRERSFNSKPPKGTGHLEDTCLWEIILKFVLEKSALNVKDGYMCLRIGSNTVMNL